jgi:hypothetical protein
MKMWKYLIAVIIFGCSSDKDPNNKIIAKYKDAQLTVGLLKSMLPNNLSTLDSARIAGLFIDQWIADQILVNEAKSKIPNLEKTIEPMLQNYKDKLMVIELKKLYVKELNEKDIPEDTLLAWYEKKKSSFVAGENYYKCYYIMTDRTDTPEIRQRLKATKDEDFNIVKNWCEKNKVYYHLEDNWISHQVFQKKIQSKIPTQNYSILPPSATVHFAITNYPKPVFHFFLMIDVIKAGQPLPYEMVKEQVKALVIHEKSNKGFEEYAKQLLLKVKSNNEVQFFD